MGIAALIIGIVAVVLGLIPGCGLIFGLPPAIVGLILGIIEMKKKGKANQPKGMGLAGTILNALAIVIILVWTLVIAAGAKEGVEGLEEFSSELEAAAETMAEEVESAAEEAAVEGEPAPDATP